MYQNIIGKVVFLTVSVFLLLVVLLLAWSFLFSPMDQGGVYAVYLDSGDLYFGNLERFPTFGLRQVYLLRLGGQDSGVGIQQFKNAFWGPDDFLSINPDKVLWVAHLRSDSELGMLIRQNPELIPPQALPQSNEGNSGVPQE